MSIPFYSYSVLVKFGEKMDSARVVNAVLSKAAEMIILNRDELEEVTLIAYKVSP